MGINAYVLPVSGFLAGDFISLSIKLGGETLVRRRDTDVRQAQAARWVRRIIPDDPKELEVRQTRVRERRAKSLEAAHALQAEVGRVAGVSVAWNENGSSAFETPLWREVVTALRDYAKADDGYHPHLTEHSLKGFYVPVPLHRPFSAEEKVVLRKMVDIGSSNALLDELNALNKRLHVEGRWDALLDGGRLGDDPVKVGWALFESLARKSVETLTPICLEGE